MQRLVTSDSLAKGDLPALCERDVLTIEAPVPTDGRWPTLLIAGEERTPRIVVAEDGRRNLAWTLEIEEYAGWLEVAFVSCPNEERVTALFWIDPAGHKIGSAFGELIADIEARLAGLGIGLGRSEMTMARARTRAPPLVSLLRLVAGARQLEQAFRPIAEQPDWRYVRQRDYLPLRRVRRVDRRNARKLIAPGPQTQVDHVIARESYDTPSNRLVKWLLAELLRRERLLASLIDAESPLEPAERARMVVWARELDRSARRLERLADRTFLRHVPVRAPGTGEALAPLGLPAYGRWVGLAKAILHPRAHISWDSSDGERAPLPATWKLYEQWVLLAVIDDLASHLDCGRPDLSQVARSPGLLRDLARATVFVGDVRVDYQPVFGRRHGSISSRCIPDIVLTRGERRLLLDAKYRGSWPAIDQGMNELHRYRDALRDWKTSVALFPEAYVVVPACPDTSLPYAQPEYQTQHRFGAIVARPRNTVGLRDRLGAWLGA